MPPIKRRSKSLWAVLASMAALAQPAAAQRWGTVWSGSDQGPYPIGNTSAQPDLSFAFPHAQTGAHEQTFRLIIKPDLWARQVRFRFSNSFGTGAVTFDGVFAGLQESGAEVASGTNRPVTFGGKKSLTLEPGKQAWSDPVLLPWVGYHPAEMSGRKLAVSFHVPGDSGPMTWHAKAMTTSYVSAPDAGAVGGLEDDGAFPNSTTSWYFLDAMDAAVPLGTRVVVCLGDSITDGTASTLNGDDRWTDVLSRRLHAVDPAHVAMVNAGIGGNQVAGPAAYSPATPFAGGPAATARLERDVLDLSGVTDVIVFEGINDLGSAGASADMVAAADRAIADRVRATIKGVHVVGATITTSRGSSVPGYGSAETDTRRHQLNALIAKPGLFDSVIDFDAAVTDRQTGELRPEFVAPSTFGGPGDKLHPNRAGYLAMGNAVELHLFVPPPRPAPRPRPRPAPSPEPSSDPAPTN